MLALLHTPRKVRLLDGLTFAELASFSLEEQQAVRSLLFSPDGSRLIAGTTAPGFVHIWDLHRMRKQLSDVRLDWPHVKEKGSGLID